MMNDKKHLSVFAVGVFAGLGVALVLSAAFLPAQTGQVLNFSLSELTNAKQAIAPANPFGLLKNFFQADSVLTRQGVIQFTNVARAENATGTASGIPLGPLKENTVLDGVALTKANDMLTNQYFEHISPVTGKGPSDLDTAAGYSYIIVGENLAEGNFTSDQALVTAWMGSPGHRANILDDRYQDIGVAVVKGKYKGNTVWMAVQEFGVPSSACTAADEGLSAKIAANKLELAGEDSDINAMKQNLNTLNVRNNTYAIQAEKYNELVVSYNGLINATQSMVDQYNAQVKSYNTCAQAN